MYWQCYDEGQWSEEQAARRQRGRLRRGAARRPPPCTRGEVASIALEHDLFIVVFTMSVESWYV